MDDAPDAIQLVVRIRTDEQPELVAALRGIRNKFVRADFLRKLAAYGLQCTTASTRMALGIPKAPIQPAPVQVVPVQAAPVQQVPVQPEINSRPASMDSPGSEEDDLVVRLAKKGLFCDGMR